MIASQRNVGVLRVSNRQRGTLRQRNKPTGGEEEGKRSLHATWRCCAAPSWKQEETPHLQEALARLARVPPSPQST